MPESRFSTPPVQSRVWLEIDLDAIRENFRRIRASVAPALVMPILKADAYGLGAGRIAAALAGEAPARFGVAEAKEAIALRRKVKQPVQIIGGLLADEAEHCVRAGIICPVGDLAIAKKLSSEAVRQGKKAKVHIKVDTGMGRLGLPHFEASAVILKILRLPGLEIEGFYTHFANANNAQHAKTREQVTLFSRLLHELEAQGIVFPLVHLANSDAINNFPETHFDMVRPGINLYGVFDLEGCRRYHLKPSLSLKSRLLSKRLLPAGFTIGYGCTHTLMRDTWVGTIPAGYADGIPLAASNSGRVLIRGKRCPIIGRVSMDYITVDLGECPKSRVGDTVVIAGRSGKEEITMEDWARIKQTHPYDIICSLGNRVERVYSG